MKAKFTFYTQNLTFVVFLSTLFVMATFMSNDVAAQVSINNDESLPDPSAMLDVKATGLGMLVPRMTMAERPTSPAVGLMIYQTDNNPGFYFYNGTAWQRFGTAAENPWIQNSNGIFYNSGNVGLGTENPGSSLVIVKDTPGIGLFDTTNQSNIYLIAPDEETTGGLGTASHHGFPLFTNNVDRMWIGKDGNIGIGNLEPSELLDVSGNIKTDGLMIPDGANDGYILKSDATGYASWQPFFDAPSAGDTMVNDTSFSSKPILSLQETYDTINVDLDWFTIKPETIIEVCLNITHTWDQDLVISLISPEGIEVELSSGNGGGGQNYTATCFTKTASISITDGTPPFTGEFLPEGNFYDFDGIAVSGDWVLKIYDQYDEDEGTLDNWSIRFTETNFDENEKWMLTHGNLYSNRNVGIGTTVPDGLLHIKAGRGSTYFPSWPGSEVMGTVVLGVMDGKGFGSQLRFSGGESGFIDIGQDSLGSFVIEGSDSPKFLVNQSGNVGIGTTDPQSSLQIIKDYADFSLINSSTESNIALIAPAENATGGLGTISDHGFPLFTNNQDRMWIGNNGKIGIGTINPGEILQVGDYTDAGNKYLGIRTSGGNLYKAGIKLRHYTDAFGWTLQSDETNNLFSIIRHLGDTNGEPALSISGFTGNVGIGTTTPTHDLTVAGNTSVSGRLGVGGSTYSDVTHRIKTSSSDNWGIYMQNESDQRVFGIEKEGNMVLKGKSAIGTEFYYNNVTQRIKALSTDEYALYVEDNNNTSLFYMNRSGGGSLATGTNQLHVHGPASGNPTNYTSSYPLYVSGAQQGIAIRLNTAQAHAGNNFLYFVDNSYIRGSVAGQNLSELQNSSEYIWFNTMAALDESFIYAEEIACAFQLDAAEVAVMAFEGIAVYVEWAERFWDMESNVGVVYQSNAADYAEWLERDDHSIDLLPGTIVGVYGGKVSTNTEKARQLLVVSTAPMVLGNTPPPGQEAEYEKVAFMGQVPVRVRGLVNVGDYILASGLNDGIGVAVAPDRMLLKDYDRVVGMAWSGSSLSNGATMINVAVGLNTNDLLGEIKKQRSEVQELKSTVNELLSYLKEKDPSLTIELNEPKYATAASTTNSVSNTLIPQEQILQERDIPDPANLGRFFEEHPDQLDEMLTQAREIWLQRGNELTAEWDAKLFGRQAFMERLASTRPPVQYKQPGVAVDDQPAPPAPREATESELQPDKMDD